MSFADIETPALLLDRERLTANCERMRARCRSLGVALRPHMKTLKAIEAARLALDPEHGGIAVSTFREADYFADEGISDIQLAICISPDKLNRAAALARRTAKFSFFVDSPTTAAAIAGRARADQVPFRVWIEVDSGQHRTGTPPDGEELVAIAAALAEGPVTLAGVATHAGQSYSGRNLEEMADVAEAERQAAVSAADRLRAAGHPVQGVSAGSTPTAIHSRSAHGLTELRPGVYMAGDLFQAAIGSQRLEDIAVSVLGTVISHGREPDRILIDAGALALSKDRSTAAIEGGDLGYGLVTDASGEQSLGPLIVSGVNQEHGEIAVSDPSLFDRLPVGSKVRILPNHACMTTAMYDRFLVLSGQDLVAEWGKTGGW